LNMAIRYGRELCTRLLLEQGADAWGEHFEQPIHAAAVYGRVGCMRLLLEHEGRLANECLGIRGTALHSLMHADCEADDRLKCLRLLLEAGAEVDAANNCMATPLHLACDRGSMRMCCIKNEDVVCALLEAGANPNLLGRPLFSGAVDDTKIPPLFCVFGQPWKEKIARALVVSPRIDLFARDEKKCSLIEYLRDRDARARELRFSPTDRVQMIAIYASAIRERLEAAHDALWENRERTRYRIKWQRGSDCQLPDPIPCDLVARHVAPFLVDQEILARCTDFVQAPAWREREEPICEGGVPMAEHKNRYRGWDPEKFGWEPD